MIIYNKLIRDRIPEIIEADGKKCDVKVLDDKEYFECLNKKLGEELKEYYMSGEVEELADVAEIIYAIAKHKGVSEEQFEKIRLEKKEKRGGFAKKLFLMKVFEKDDFEDVWKDIIKIIETDNIIRTLEHGNINKVVDIVEDGLMVLTTDKPELVRKEWVKASWDILVKKRKIKADDIPGPGRYRSSFIMALLSHLNHVRNEINPITLYIEQ